MQPIKIAYLSMEVGLESNMPTYSGGLGGLAGDTLKAAADAGLPLAGVTLVHHKGYFRQRLNDAGQQVELPAVWHPADVLDPTNTKVSVWIEGRQVAVTAWRYTVVGASGDTVPVYFLDTNLPENDPADREFTDHLYGGDQRYRICQEAILGIGGVRMLKALGHDDVETYHLNEGHASFACPALFVEQGLAFDRVDDVLRVRAQCVFTTHTPVPAGHDRFDWSLVESVVEPDVLSIVRAAPLHESESCLNMTSLAMYFSGKLNAVSERHGEVARAMFGREDITYVTNGVHVPTWASPQFASVYDKVTPGWRVDNSRLSQVLELPLDTIEDAHRRAKRTLLDRVREETGVVLSENVFTIGFARRATAYKRADLLVREPARLREIAAKAGGLQVIFAGKAHPHDEAGKELIRRVIAAGDAVAPEVRLVYLPNQSMELTGQLCAGVDLWLNNPEKPREASGTSGMKAALNGVPSLSVLDGWWVEGWSEGVTGWSIGDSVHETSDAEDAEELYRKLEEAVVPSYLQRTPFLEVQRNAIAMNGARFTAQAMLHNYATFLYGYGLPVASGVSTAGSRVE